MRVKFLFAALVAFSSAVAAAPVRAAEVTIGFGVKGALTASGQNNAAFNAGPGNVLVGRSSQSTHRNYFVFDLTGVSDDVLAANLVVQSPFGSYISADATETWTIYDYTSSIAVLQNQSSVNVAAYNDLGSGDEYGSTVVSEASEGVANGPRFPVIIPLNAAALSDINAARGGLFALGGAITTIGGTSTQNFFAFSGNDDNAQLVLNPVPEPSGTIALLGVSVAALGRRRRRL